MFAKDQSHILESWASALQCPPYAFTYWSLVVGIISISLPPLTSSKLRYLLIAHSYIIVTIFFFYCSLYTQSLSKVHYNITNPLLRHKTWLPTDGIVRLKFIHVLLLLFKIWSPAYQTRLASYYLFHMHGSLTKQISEQLPTY